MAVTELPRDIRGLTISALRPMIGGAHQIAITNTTAINSVAFNDATRIIGIWSTQDCHIEIATVSVVATTSDHFIPKELYFYFSITLGEVSFTHIAGIRSTINGTLYVSEFQ